MLALFLFLAATVETINELTFGRLFGKGKVYPEHGKVLPFTALFFGVLIGFVSELALLAWATQSIAGASLQIVPEADHLISGVLISAGSGYLHRFLSQYAPEKSPTS